MTKEKLKSAIIKKFGKLSIFARCAGIDRYDLQLFFNRNEIPKAEAKEMATKIRLTAVNSDMGGTVETSKVDRLKQAITDCGGVYAFCREHPEFPQRRVYDLFKSENRKRTSKLLKSLFDHFKIE